MSHYYQPFLKNVKYQITKLKGDNKRLEELAVPDLFLQTVVSTVTWFSFRLFLLVLLFYRQELASDYLVSENNAPLFIHGEN